MARRCCARPGARQLGHVRQGRGQDWLARVTRDLEPTNVGHGAESGAAGARGRDGVQV